MRGSSPNWTAGVPYVSTRTKEGKTLYWTRGESRWETGTGRATGSNGFYYAPYGSKYRARWYLGDRQGTYQLDVFIPKSGASPEATAQAEYTVWEKRIDESHYHRIAKFSLNQESSREKGWRRFTSEFEIDGRLYVEVRRKPRHSGGVLTADSIRVTSVDVLPEHYESAREMCEQGVVKALSVTVVGVSAIAAAVVATYIGPAALTKAAARSLVNDAKLLVGSPAAYYSVERAKEIVWNELKRRGLDVWDDAVSSYRQGCKHFRAPRIYLGITRGYGNYADDLAKAVGQRRLGANR